MKKQQKAGWQELDLQLLDQSGLFNDVFWFFDLTSNQLQFSRSWSEMSGYPIDEIACFADYCAITHVRDLPDLLQKIRCFIRERTQKTEICHRLICRSGQARPVKLKICRLQSASGREWLVGSISDDCRPYSEQPSDTFKNQDMILRMHQGLENNGFSLVYQPQFDVASGQLNGMEALLRWHDEKYGQVPPLEFIPIAEDCGLMVPIGYWVLEQVCRQLAEWLRQGLQVVPVAVNISSTQFLDPVFFAKLRRLIQQTRLRPDLLELEITETLYLNASQDIQNLLKQIRDLGVKIALDDFGSGYSSLTYIKNFRLDRLKIDRSFIRDIQPNTVDAEIINTIVMLAHILNLSVVAEGVETAEQLDTLKEIGCNSVQGFLFSQPVSAAKMREWL